VLLERRLFRAITRLGDLLGCRRHLHGELRQRLQVVRRHLHRQRGLLLERRLQRGQDLHRRGRVVHL
jgi:hypothetical protein